MLARSGSGLTYEDQESIEILVGFLERAEPVFLDQLTELAGLRIVNISPCEKAAVLTIVGKEFHQAFREEVTHTTVLMLDRFQLRVEIGLNIQGGVRTTRASEEWILRSGNPPQSKSEELTNSPAGRELAQIRLHSPPPRRATPRRTPQRLCSTLTFPISLGR